MKWQESRTNYKSRLPHIQPIGGSFFVTFRQKGTLSSKIIETIHEKLEANKFKDPDSIRHKKKYFQYMEEFLDKESSSNGILNRSDIAKIISDTLHKYDGKYYDLITYCIMPNHVHLLIDLSIQLVNEDGFYLSEIPSNYMQLHEIMRLIKGGTAFSINKLLCKKGPFWQKDSYDHFVRNEREWNNIIDYIYLNPVKAKLVKEGEDWAFMYQKQE